MTFTVSEYIIHSTLYNLNGRDRLFLLCCIYFEPHIWNGMENFILKRLPDPQCPFCHILWSWMNSFWSCMACHHGGIHQVELQSFLHVGNSSYFYSSSWLHSSSQWQDLLLIITSCQLGFQFILFYFDRSVHFIWV